MATRQQEMLRPQVWCQGAIQMSSRMGPRCMIVCQLPPGIYHLPDRHITECVAPCTCTWLLYETEDTFEGRPESAQVLKSRHVVSNSAGASCCRCWLGSNAPFIGGAVGGGRHGAAWEE